MFLSEDSVNFLQTLALGLNPEQRLQMLALLNIHFRPPSQPFFLMKGNKA